jgi:hypothetical protein
VNGCSETANAGAFDARLLDGQDEMIFDSMRSGEPLIVQFAMIDDVASEVEVFLCSRSANDVAKKPRTAICTFTGFADDPIPPGMTGRFACQPQVGGVLRRLCLTPELLSAIGRSNVVIGVGAYDTDKAGNEIEGSRRTFEIEPGFDLVPGCKVWPSETISVAFANRSSAPVSGFDIIALMDIDPAINDLRSPRYNGLPAMSDVEHQRRFGGHR